MERREADGRKEFQNKSSCVCTGDTRLQTQQHRDVAVSLSPLPAFYPYLWCPCRCALYVFFVFDWFRNSAVPVIINCGGRGSLKKHVVIFFFLFVCLIHLFPRVIEIRECLFMVLILHQDEFCMELMRICQHC